MKYSCGVRTVHICSLNLYASRAPARIFAFGRIGGVCKLYINYLMLFEAGKAATLLTRSELNNMGRSQQI